MLVTGIITTYPRLRLLVISEFISSNRRAKLSARGRRLLSVRTHREWIDDKFSSDFTWVSNPVEERLRREFCFWWPRTAGIAILPTSHPWRKPYPSEFRAPAPTGRAY